MVSAKKMELMSELHTLLSLEWPSLEWGCSSCFFFIFRGACWITVRQAGLATAGFAGGGGSGAQDVTDCGMVVSGHEQDHIWQIHLLPEKQTITVMVSAKKMDFICQSYALFWPANELDEYGGKIEHHHHPIVVGLLHWPRLSYRFLPPAIEGHTQQEIPLPSHPQIDQLLGTAIVQHTCNCNTAFINNSSK